MVAQVVGVAERDEVLAVPAAEVPGASSQVAVTVQGVCEGLPALSAPDRTLLLLLLLLFLFLLMLDVVFVELGDALDNSATGLTLE